jgi:mono/diheme cytochrome c family protein
MTMSLSRALVCLSSVALGALGFAACGSDGGPALSPEADAGRSTMRSNGCASCHGANGQGGVGPALDGLYGTEVSLEDGTTVTADDEYLRRSIEEPSAQIVEGYSLPMPTNDLDADEIDQIIAYIAAIGTEETPG